MGKKVVLDTNILISSLGWEGKPRKIFRKILEGKLELTISKEQLAELERVLNYPKFEFTEEQKICFLKIVRSISKVVEIPNKLRVIKKDPADNIILETALEGKADFIISGDNHLLQLKKWERIRIITADGFLKI